MKRLVRWQSAVAVVGPPRWVVEAGFEARDAWVGVFWDRGQEDAFARIAGSAQHGWQRFPRLDVYVCPLPFLVLHVRRLGRPRPGALAHT